MSEQFDCAIIGAGVFGLAIARRMAMAGRAVVILETEVAFGNHTSTCNSETILADGTLQPSYTGIRSRITGPGEPVQDFTFSGPRDHGISGLLKLYGVELLGLTSSLAIADHVANLLA